MDCFAAKNLMRVLGVLVDYRLVSSQTYSQFLLQMLEECDNLKHHSLDLVLESIMTGLPIAVNYCILIKIVGVKIKQRTRNRLRNNIGDHQTITKQERAVVSNYGARTVPDEEQPGYIEFVVGELLPERRQAI